MKADKEQFEKLSVEQLQGKLEEYRRDLFSLRLNISSGDVKELGRMRGLKKNVARVLTYARQKYNS